MMTNDVFVVICAIFIGSTMGSIQLLEARLQVTVTAEEDMVGKVLGDMSESYNNEKIVVFVGDQLDMSRLFRHMAGMNVLTENFKIIVVNELSQIKRIVQHLMWTHETRFMVVMQRREKSDDFFVDLNHQSISFDVLTEEEIRRDLDGRNSRDEEQHWQEVKQLLRNFWLNQITHILILVPKRWNVYFYTYFPFTEVNCPGELAPVLVNVWFSRQRTFQRSHYMFPDKTKNLYGCTLNVSLIPCPPGVMTEEGRVDGIEGELLKNIFHYINATPRFHFVNQQEVSMNASQTPLNFLLAKVKSGESDIGAGFLLPTSAYVGCTDNIHVGISLCLTWAVPRRWESGEILHFITDPFTKELWTMIVLLTMSSSFILWYLLRFKVQDVILNSIFCVFAVTLGKPIKYPRQKLPKSLLVALIWYSIILGSAYQAGLGSNNIMPRPPPQFESTQDIIESGYEITSGESMVNLFREDIKLIRYDGQTAEVEPMDIHSALVKVAFEKKTAYIGLRLSISYYTQFLNPNLLDHIYVYPSCLVNYQPFFALRKNSPLIGHVRTIMTALIENGYKSKLEHKYLSRRIRRGRSHRASKGDMLARNSMAVFVFGICLSTAVFFAECLYYYITRKFSLRTVARGIPMPQLPSLT